MYASKHQTILKIVLYDRKVELQQIADILETSKVCIHKILQNKFVYKKTVSIKSFWNWIINI